MTELAFVVSRTFWTSFVLFIERLSAQYKKNRRIRTDRLRIVAELSSCTDRELAELGFSRFDFPSIANGTYQR